MFTCKSNALFPKYRPDPELDSSDRCIEYRKMDGEVRDIFTNTKAYPPKYFIAKYVQKEKENDPGSYFNRPYNPHDWNNPISHVKVYDIVNHGWRTLRVWEIISEVDGTPPLPTCSDDRKKVHEELEKEVDERNISASYDTTNRDLFSLLKKVKGWNDVHKELIEKVENMDTNWADRYQESLQDNQRLKKKLGKWMRRAQEFKDKYEELKEEYDRISMYRIR